MLQLLYAFASQFEFLVRGLLGLLDEGMHNNHAFADQEAIERTTDTGSTARPQLEESIAPRARVR